MRTQGYRNAVLTAIAVLLALNLLAGLDAGPAESLAQTRAVSSSARPADAAPPIDDESTPNARISAAEQRRTMIHELRGMSQRLDRIEAAMRAGLNVRVTEMPELRLPPARDAK